MKNNTNKKGKKENEAPEPTEKKDGKSKNGGTKKGGEKKQVDEKELQKMIQEKITAIEG